MLARKQIRFFVACLVMFQIAIYSTQFVSVAHAEQTTPKTVISSQDVKKYQLDTENGLFKIEISIQNDFTLGNNVFDMHILTREGKYVKAARVLVVPWMADHIHGVGALPIVTDKSGGVYHVENVELNMKGPWEIKIRIIYEGVTDKAVLELPDIS